MNVGDIIGMYMVTLIVLGLIIALTAAFITADMEDGDLMNKLVPPRMIVVAIVLWPLSPFIIYKLIKDSKPVIGNNWLDKYLN